MSFEGFEIDLSKYQKVAIDPFSTAALSAEQLAGIKANIELCRDAIVFFTACGSASGYGGHTGGAFDTVPEVVLLDAFFRACPDKFVPILFDEAGHRVATQYREQPVFCLPSVPPDSRKNCENSCFHSERPYGRPGLGLSDSRPQSCRSSRARCPPLS